MNQIHENGVMLKIHKGTDEIGGSCIELSTNNTTILLDYGTPLVGLLMENDRLEPQCLNKVSHGVLSLFIATVNDEYVRA